MPLLYRAGIDLLIHTARIGSRVAVAVVSVLGYRLANATDVMIVNASGDKLKHGG